MNSVKKILLLLIFVSSITLGQDEGVELGQLFLGIKNVGQNEIVAHKIEAVGPVWIKNNNNEINYFIASDQPVYISSDTTIGNYPQSRAVFNWFWKGVYPDIGCWGLGIYKISNSKYPDKYFYLDTRNNVYPDTQYVNPDVWFFYNPLTSKYYCDRRCDSNSIPIENGALIRIKDILNLNFRTDRLLNFWENGLVIIPSTNQPPNPRAVWGPISNFNTSGYKIYWRLDQSGNFSLLSTVSSNSFDYIHEGIALGSGMVAEYKVQAYNSNFASNFTNTSSINVSGFYKQNYNTEDLPSNYQLKQNYPNPFNTVTNIEYEVPKNSFVSIKVYDLLGNELVSLVEDYRQTGRYSIIFDASRFSSGLYFYTMKSGDYFLTKKMLLIK